MMHTDTTQLDTAWAAQLAHAAAMISDALERGTSDDGHDYLIGALDLASTLEDLRYDSDSYGYQKLLMLNDESDEFSAPLMINYATDGICETIWNDFKALNPDA